MRVAKLCLRDFRLFDETEVFIGKKKLPSPGITARANQLF